MAATSDKHTSDSNHQSYNDSCAVNPFISYLEVPWYRYPQIMLMSVTIAPLRLLTLFILTIIAWIFASVSLVTIDYEEYQSMPVVGWRSQIREFIRWLGRIGVYVTGFSVDIRGTQADNSESMAIVCAPHSSFLDSMLLFLTQDTHAVIAKQEAADTPFFGKLMKTTHPILVPREDKNASKKVIHEIKERAKDFGIWEQLMLFPEGTCTNRQALIPFKLGAFIPGRPIQPVTLQFPNKWDTFTWTWVGSSPTWLLAWLTLCQFRSHFVLTFLPVYHPSEEEQADAKLYSDNVRKLMADSLKVPCSPLTLADGKEMYKEDRKNREHGLIDRKPYDYRILIKFILAAFVVEFVAAVSFLIW